MITLPSGRKIGPGEKPFIIAEIGSNWRTLDDCLHSISMAKAAGADAVKFQAFDEQALYGVPQDVWARNHYQLDEVYSTDGMPDMEGKLPLDWLPKLKIKADACGIEFMCSAFSPELVAAVNPFVNLHKVASAELSHVRMLEALRDIGKPVILSTGASGPRDIERALATLRGRSDWDQVTGSANWGPFDREVVLMYCVAAYPARDIDFRMIAELKKLAPCVGFSDHTTDYGVIPKLAVDSGACVIEKHMTDIPEINTPDRPHSLTVDEFKKMVQTVRGERPFTWGSGEEKEMVTRHNRRLVAIREIKAGEPLTSDGESPNFGIYRSLVDDTHGLSPFAIGKVSGRTATRAVQAGESIGPGDFE